MGGAWTSLDTPTYISLMEARKIGGQPVTLTIDAVSLTPEVAWVDATRMTPTHRFQDHITLVRDEGAWRISSTAVVAAPL